MTKFDQNRPILKKGDSEKREIKRQDTYASRKTGPQTVTVIAPETDDIVEVVWACLRKQRKQYLQMVIGSLEDMYLKADLYAVRDHTFDLIDRYERRKFTKLVNCLVKGPELEVDELFNNIYLPEHARKRKIEWNYYWLFRTYDDARSELRVAGGKMLRNRKFDAKRNSLAS